MLEEGRKDGINYGMIDLPKHYYVHEIQKIQLEKQEDNDIYMLIKANPDNRSKHLKYQQSVINE